MNDSGPIERIADAVEDGAEMMTSSTSQSSRNFFALVTMFASVISVIASVGFSYIVNRVSTDYRLSDLERASATYQTRLVDLEKFQTADHTSSDIATLGIQVQELTTIVKADHDAITRVLAVWDQRQTRPNG